MGFEFFKRLPLTGRAVTLVTLLGLGVSQSGCATAAAAQSTDDLFGQHEIVTGMADHQTTLPGFFLGGPVADLVVVYVDEHDDRRLQMYGYDGVTWVAIRDAVLGRDVTFVDVAD